MEILKRVSKYTCMSFYHCDIVPNAFKFLLPHSSQIMSYYHTVIKYISYYHIVPSCISYYHIVHKLSLTKYIVLNYVLLPGFYYHLDRAVSYYHAVRVICNYRNFIQILSMYLEGVHNLGKRYRTVHKSQTYRHAIINEAPHAPKSCDYQCCLKYSL